MKKAGQHPWCGNFCALGEWWLESWLLVVAGHVLGEWWLESHELWVGAGQPQFSRNWVVAGQPQFSRNCVWAVVGKP